MRKNLIEIKAIYISLLIFFALFLIFPTVMIIFQSLQTKGSGWNFDNYFHVLADANFLQAILNSFKVSILASLITLILAIILAYSVHFTNIPKWLKNGIKVLSVFPMLLPTITYGFAIIYSFGNQGLITQIINFKLFDIYGFNGLLIGYVIYTLPIAFLLISDSLEYVDKKYITVSKLMADSSIKTFFIAFLRPIVGSLGAAFIQSFFLSFTDFGIPAAIGGEYHVLATILYNTMLGSIPDFGGGAVVAIVMLIPSIISIMLLSYLKRFNFRCDKSSIIELSKNKLRDISCGTISSMIILSILMVFMVIFIIPFTKMWPYNFYFTLEQFQLIFANAQLLFVYKNSIVVALITGIISTIITYSAALVSERSNLSTKLKTIIDSLAMVINTIPGMVLGIAFLFAFTGTSLQNTFIILIVSNIIHFFSTPYLMMKNSLSKMNSSWETTARLMGDSWIKTIIRVITPNSKNTILAVFEYYFINSMVTISAVIFLAGAKTMVITSKLKELQYMAKFEQIFVFSILILLTNLLVKLIVKLLTSNKNKT